jgi:hypothetical protein
MKYIIVTVDSVFMINNNYEVVMKTAAYMILSLFALLMEFLFKKSKPAH